MDLRSKLISINRDLVSKGITLRIEQRGQKLNLRGPLPSQKTNGLIETQRISLNLSATLYGLKEAQKILQLVVLQLQHHQFDWKHWKKYRIQNKKKKYNSFTIDVIKDFEQAFFNDPNRRKSLSGTRTTWSSAYLPYLRRLIKQSESQKEKLNKDVFCKTLMSYTENSRSRQQCATALNAFAQHIDLSLPDDWRSQSSGYGLHKAKFRDLPSDDLIKETWLKIPNQSWRLVFGLMATFGLRNHEVFFCDFSCLSNKQDQVIRVFPTTKTGEHQSWPFYPEWIELFELAKLAKEPKSLPSVKVDLNKTTLQQVGRRVAEQFRRYKLPVTPYDLRHAWAIRTIHIGLPDTVAARMMGHSVAIHTRTYHHWITRRDQQKAVDAALSKN